MATYDVPKPYFSTTTQYVGVPQYGDEPSPALSPDYHKQDHSLQRPEVNLQSHPQLRGHRSWFKTAVIQLYCLLWTAPVGFLLYFNLHGWILGASSWCPGTSCLPQQFNPTTSIPQLIAARNDRHNHNLLGALQLAAKALEVWFILIATWLVYLITMFLAGRRGGLPIAYITRPHEFSEIAGLLDPLLWKTLPKPFRTTGLKKSRKRVWIFVAFTVSLGILCNLMGPAIAVLVLPTLHWVHVPGFKMATFVQHNSATPPSSDGASFFQQATGCTAEMIANDMWECTTSPFAAQMDGWVESFIASAGAVNGITSQGTTTFAFNSTALVSQDGTVSDFLSWAPSRQTIQGLAYDFAMVQYISNGGDFDTLKREANFTEDDREWFDSALPYNNTVATYLQRNGPIMGVAANMWLDYDDQTWWDSFLDDKKDTAVRCYQNYNISNTPLSRNVLHGTYTKCVKWGPGWDFDYRHQSFTINGTWKDQINAFGPFVAFDVWTSDKAAFYPDGQLPAGLSPDCLPVNAVVPSSLNCDWDAFFAVTNDSVLATRSEYVNTIHLSTMYAPDDGHPTSMNLMFDFVAYLSFTTYSLDPSPITNPLALITFPDLPMSGKAMPVDPSWILAAWSASDGGTIKPGRAAALAITTAFDTFWETPYYTSPDPLSAYYPYPDFIALLPIVQALSIVDYEVDRNMSTAVDKDHPILISNGRINVWAYGMSSRSSWLGIVVACAGGVIVIFQFLLGIIDRRPYRSPTELLVAALEHAPNSEEFSGRNHDELAIARTPFQVEDMYMGHASTFRFQKLK